MTSGPESAQGRQDAAASAGEAHGERPWWKPRPPEAKRLGASAGVLGAFSAITSLVGLYAHNPTAILAWSAGLTAIAVLAFVAINRGFTIKVGLPLPVLIGALLVAVLAGAALGGTLGHVLRTAGPARNQSSVRAPDHVIGGSAAATATQAAALPSGTITTPASGAVVGAYKMLPSSGTARNIQPGYRLDLFLKFADLGVYYAAGDPNSALRFADGRWHGSIYIGGAAPCTVYLVDLSPSSVQLMNSETSYQENGFPNIADLGTVLASVTLTSQ